MIHGSNSHSKTFDYEDNHHHHKHNGGGHVHLDDHGNIIHHEGNHDDHHHLGDEFHGKPTVNVRGRIISFEECQFVFERVWKATLKASNDKNRDETSVHINELFHVIDLVGTFLNKEEPTDEDEMPYCMW